MLYRFLLSKKGFTMMEILIVVVIMSILLCIAVPVFTGVLDEQRKSDCNNQRIVVKTAVQQAMYGMIDNGKRQYEIDFSKCDSDITYNSTNVKGYVNSAYEGQQCFVLSYKTKGEGETTQMKPYYSDTAAFTLGDLRGGYRDTSAYPDYSDGCDQGYYLKKKDYKDNPFYEYLDNQEIPVCPFADFSVTEQTEYYYYYIFSDGTVLCGCPECNEAD